jgi:hypothetical protein
MTLHSVLKGRTWVKQLLLITAALSQYSSCGDDNADRPEVLKKLRTLGVEQNPINAKPGDTVNLTFHLAGPQGLTIAPSVELDTVSRYGVAQPVTPIDAQPTETAVGPLSLYAYRTTLSVPTDNALVAASLAKQGYARLRYKVRFSAGSEYEAVVGDTVVYPSTAPQLAWKSPEIAISKPVDAAASGTIDLEGTISSEGSESYRVSWFVSDGKVKNRRAKITSWSDATKGTQTLIMTVRGTKSGAFVLKSQSVTLN